MGLENKARVKVVPLVAIASPNWHPGSGNACEFLDGPQLGGRRRAPVAGEIVTHLFIPRDEGLRRKEDAIAAFDLRLANRRKGSIDLRKAPRFPRRAESARAYGCRSLGTKGEPRLRSLAS